MDKLEALHKRLALLTPSELLDETLNAADCFRRAASSPRHEERFAGLETLRALVREYEQAMHSRRSSATAQGWLDWLQERTPGRASGGQEAVQVWTYHKSKGLERKIVILHGLSDKKQNIDIFQPIVFTAGSINAEADPLDGRKLEWIPNVFRKATELVKDKDGRSFFTERKEMLERESVEESQRLLYVGMTRACDVLVLSANLKKKGGISSSWLEPFLNGRNKKGKKEGLLELSDIADAENGSTAVFRGSTFLVSRTIGVEPAEWGSPQGEEKVKLFPRAVESTNDKDVPVAKAAPVLAKWIPFLGAGVDTSGISSTAPRDQLGNMLHGWFAVWFGMSREQREAERASGRMVKRLERFCTLWNESFKLWEDAQAHLPALSDALENAVQDWFERREDKRPGDELIIRTEWPLEHRMEETANG
ncbi:MAG: hypothetical protein IKJ34_03550, partial [Mailhella sp.]|nr:hypothetical protein [Mailhella sp.]